MKKKILSILNFFVAIRYDGVMKMKKKILYILNFIVAMLFFYKNYNFELNVGSGMFLITGAVGSYIIINTMLNKYE